MRVTLSYSLDINEVPAEISDLINRRVKELHDAVDLVEDTSVTLREKDPNIEINATAIDRARQKLASFDAVLADIYGILAGLFDAKRQMQSESVAKNNMSESSPIPEALVEPPESTDV